jgi:hypothetical protein
MAAPAVAGPAAGRAGSDAVSAIAGPVRVAWRESALTRATELEMLCAWMKSSTDKWTDGHEQLLTALNVHLAAVRQAALGVRTGPRRWPRFRNGSLLERSTSNLDAAEADLLSIAPPDYLLGQIPCLLRQVQCHLSPTDARRQEFERIATRLGIKDPYHPLSAAPTDRGKLLELVDEERRAIVTIVRGASSAALREQVRLRSFRNIVVISAVIMALLAVVVAVVGFARPTLIPLCFAPQEAGTTVVVCPTGESEPFVRAGAPALPGVPTRDIDTVVAETATMSDVVVVELVGLIAAAVAAAAAVRRIKGSSERHALPVALAALKLPTGAITAFLGLLLMRGQFVPGLTALDTSAQILAWALVFGYGQELFTRMVDVQGQTVLENVRGGGTPAQGGPGSG